MRKGKDFSMVDDIGPMRLVAMINTRDAIKIIPSMTRCQSITILKSAVQDITKGVMISTLTTLLTQRLENVDIMTSADMILFDHILSVAMPEPQVHMSNATSINMNTCVVLRKGLRALISRLIRK